MISRNGSVILRKRSEKLVSHPRGGGGGGTRDFKWRGWSKDFYFRFGEERCVTILKTAARETRSHISWCGRFFSLTNRQNFKEAVQNVWRATIFGQATKSLVSWQAQPILRQVILFREHYPEKPLWRGNNKVCKYQSSFKWRFLLYEKFHVSHMQTRLQKRKISDNNIFFFFFCKHQALFFTVVRLRVVRTGLK